MPPCGKYPQCSYKLCPRQGCPINGAVSLNKDWGVPCTTCSVGVSTLLTPKLGLSSGILGLHHGHSCFFRETLNGGLCWCSGRTREPGWCVCVRARGRIKIKKKKIKNSSTAQSLFRRDIHSLPLLFLVLTPTGLHLFLLRRLF